MDEAMEHVSRKRSPKVREGVVRKTCWEQSMRSSSELRSESKSMMEGMEGWGAVSRICFECVRRRREVRMSKISCL